jgi:hypothetical protein
MNRFHQSQFWFFTAPDKTTGKRAPGSLASVTPKIAKLNLKINSILPAGILRYFCKKIQQITCPLICKDTRHIETFRMVEAAGLKQ